MPNSSAMTTVPEHIKNLLFEQDCVVIPDFGGFIANFHSAALHANGSILPPRRRLAFNEVLKFDDGLLSSYVAAVENRSREEALQRIRLFAEHLKTELRRKNQYRFEDLGSFSLNREGKLVFEPDDRLNFHAESYGFVPVFPKFSRKYQVETGVINLPVSRPDRQREPQPILEPDVEEVPVLELARRSERRTSWPSVAAACAVLVVSVIGYQFIQSGPASMSSFNPADVLDFEWAKSKKTEPVAKIRPVSGEAQRDVPAPVPTSLAAPAKPEPTAIPTAAITEILPKPVAAVPAAAREIKRAGTRFYVVVGGFKKVVTANKLKRELIAKGYPEASLVAPKVKGKGLVKVAVEDFDTADQANQLARQVGTRFGASAWVLKQ